MADTRRTVNRVAPKRATTTVTDEPAPAQRRNLAGWLPYAFLAMAAVFATCAVVSWRMTEPEPTNLTFVDTAATDQVKAAASNALQTLYGYNVKTIDGFKAAGEAVLTERMRKDFDATVATTVNLIKQTQASTDVRVEPIGVTQLSADRAELLVNLGVSSSKDGVAQEGASGPIVVRMQKVNDHWLVDGLHNKRG